MRNNRAHKFFPQNYSWYRGGHAFSASLNWDMRGRVKLDVLVKVLNVKMNLRNGTQVAERLGEGFTGYFAEAVEFLLPVHQLYFADPVIASG